MIYTAVCSEIAQGVSDIGTTTEGGKRTTTRGKLQKSHTLLTAELNYVDEVRWMLLREIALSTVDGVQSIPAHVAWVRNGEFF